MYAVIVHLNLDSCWLLTREVFDSIEKASEYAQQVCAGSFEIVELKELD